MDNCWGKQACTLICAAADASRQKTIAPRPARPPRQPPARRSADQRYGIAKGPTPAPVFASADASAKRFENHLLQQTTPL